MSTPRARSTLANSANNALNESRPGRMDFPHSHPTDEISVPSIRLAAPWATAEGNAGPLVARTLSPRDSRDRGATTKPVERSVCAICQRPL